MADNIQETKPPEPPAKPPEVPKPTEQKPNGPETTAQPQESQLSAHQDARNAASSEHPKATSGPEPAGLRPTQEFQAGLDDHSAARNGPEELRPTPEVQEKLNAHTAAKAEPAQESGVSLREQDSEAAQRSEDPVVPEDAQTRQAAPASQAAGDRSGAAAGAGEQAGEHAAVRQSAAAERAEASEGSAATTESVEPQSPQDANQPAADNGLDPALDNKQHQDSAMGQDAQDPPAVEQNDPHQPEAEQRVPVQPAEEHGQTPVNDIRTSTSETGAEDLSKVGDGSGPWSDEGTNHREGGAVQQMTDGSCVSASGEMLTDGRITQPELLSELGDWSNLSALRNELNDRDGAGSWTGHYFEDGSAALRQASEGPMAAQVQAPLGRAHMVILEPGENGSFTVRDPYEGSSYDVDSSWVEKYVAGGVFQ